MSCGLAARPVALVLTPEWPYPPAGGAAERTLCILEGLKRRFDLEVRVVPPSQRCLVQGRYDIVLAEHFALAAAALSPSISAGQRILDLHNVESLWLRRGALPLSDREAAVFTAERLERELLPRFDVVLATSNGEAGIARELGARKVVAVPNALPLRPRTNGKSAEGEPPAMLFSGKLDYWPNLAAIRWFYRQVWPLIKQRVPGCRWLIYGRGRQRAQEELPVSDSIEFLPQDVRPRSVFAGATIAIAPIRNGAGTRFKIIEAWGAGLPVVSTAIGAEGLPAVEGENLLLGDTPQAFADAVVRLLISPEMRGRIGAAGRATFEAELCWPAAWRSLDTAI